MTTAPAPDACRELRSKVNADRFVTIEIAQCAVPAPDDHEVVVRIEAAPVNPSDLMVLLAGGDVADAEPTPGGFRIPLDTAAWAAAHQRIGAPLPAGNEGGGIVVAAGAAPGARALLGRVVGFRSGNAFAQYRTMPASACVPMPDGITTEQAAASYVNPLTVLAMVETMRREGHSALVHTVGASNLGLMLDRVCRADGVPLVNIVRRAENAERLRSLGAEHVVDTSAATFDDDLHQELTSTRATIAFDAIGGGTMAGELLRAMERVASNGLPYSAYGSLTFKQVYVYGRLDRGPTVLPRDAGFSWSVAGWLLTHFLARVDADTRASLRARVADEITTTFASSYGLRVTLDEMVDPVVVRRYGRMASGDKALLTPHG